MERAIVVDEAARSAKDQTGDEDCSIALTWIDRIVRVENRPLLRPCRRTQENHDCEQQKMRPHQFTFTVSFVTPILLSWPVFQAVRLITLALPLTIATEAV